MTHTQWANAASGTCAAVSGRTAADADAIAPGGAADVHALLAGTVHEPTGRDGRSVTLRSGQTIASECSGGRGGGWVSNDWRRAAGRRIDGAVFDARATKGVAGAASASPGTRTNVAVCCSVLQRDVSVLQHHQARECVAVCCECAAANVMQHR